MTATVTDPDLACMCGLCGQQATRPAKNPILSEPCYRRRLRLKLPEGAIPPPPDPNNKGGRKPKPPPPPPAPDRWADAVDAAEAEAGRRISFEVAHAKAFTVAYARKDLRGMDAVRCQVMHQDAFDALIEADLDPDLAKADLAGQIRDQFPDIQQHETKAAAA